MYIHIKLRFHIKVSRSSLLFPLRKLVPSYFKGSVISTCTVGLGGMFNCQNVHVTKYTVSEGKNVISLFSLFLSASLSSHFIVPHMRLSNTMEWSLTLIILYYLWRTTINNQ